MDARPPKQLILEALEKLPPEATYEDAMETIAYLSKIAAGLEELDSGKSLSDEEVRRRLSP